MPAPRFLPFLFLFAACQNAPEPPPVEVQPTTPEEVAVQLISEGRLEEAHELLSTELADAQLDLAEDRLAAGDTRGARESLLAALELVDPNARSERLRTEIEALLFTRAVAEGRELLTTGDPRDAMLPLDDAVQISPADPELRFLRGCATLQIGIENGDVFLFQDALENFRRAARSGAQPAAWYGAALAELQLYGDDNDPARIARALASVRRGDSARTESGTDEDLLYERPERTACKISMWASSLAGSGQLVDEDPSALRAEWLVHASALIGLTPEDPWAWNQAALAYEWDGQLSEARDAARRGVAHTPEDATLHATLVRTARAVGGDAALLEVYAGLVAEFPESPSCQWNHGLAAFESGVVGLEAGPSDQALLFDTAERAFRTARRLDPSLETEALGYEVVARDGLGWSHFHAGRLDAARDAFLSMEDLIEGGLRWRLEDRMLSGMRGLEFVVFGYSQRWADESLDAEERFRSLEKAANLSSTLHEYAPENGSLANNAGFFHRDAGVAQNDAAKSLIARVTAEGGPTGPGRDRELQRARELVRRAEEHMQASYRAYLEAARLMPHDGRTVNDCALVQVYYLREDPDAADRMLQDAVDAAKLQLEAEDLTPEQVYEFKNALGDAYQNQGYLWLSIRKKPIEAKHYLLKALEVGPDPRPFVESQLLPHCELLLRDELSDAQLETIYGWPVTVPD
jgi:tetratricopeptide (TPR) repeat protein